MNYRYFLREFGDYYSDIFRIVSALEMDILVWRISALVRGSRTNITSIIFKKMKQLLFFLLLLFIIACTPVKQKIEETQDNTQSLPF